MIIQIVSVVLDWPSTCNRDLHIWMIVSLSYRLSSFIFQWICIEPCLRYLRKDRSNKANKEDDNSCFIKLLFCWVIPWLWIIDNDIFLLIWTILGTILLFHKHPPFINSCNLHHHPNTLYSHIFYYTMLTVITISYIYWITALFISICLFCCPHRINYCCNQMGYTIVRPKGIPYIHTILYISSSLVI